jgi:hypothetical protein
VIGYDNKVDDDQINEALNKLPSLLENTTFKTLLTSSDLVVVRNRFQEGIFSIYEDAKRKHENILSTGMPWWGWLVIAYTGYDDVWRFFTSGFFFPIVLIVVVFVVLNYLGLTGPVNQVRYIVQDQVTKFFFKKKFSS